MEPESLYHRLEDGHFGNVRFADLLRLAKALGYGIERIRGSHHIARHPAGAPKLNLQPDRNGDAKPYQLRQVMAAAKAFDLRIGSRRT